MSEGLISVSPPARVTGMLLWGLADDEGRLEMRPALIAGTVFPGDPSMTAETIEEHLLELSESGFLTLYPSAGRWWLQVHDPLRTPRPQPSDCPPAPLQEDSGIFLAGGRGRASAWERADERLRAEDAERAQRREDEPEEPERPLLLDAPDIGCTEHRNGTFEGCGPCRTARLQRDVWLTRETYRRKLVRVEEARDEAARPR